MANTLYDRDADEQHDLSRIKSAETDADQSRYDREFDDITNNFGDSAEHPLGKGEAGGDKSVPPEELATKEDDAGDKHGSSAADDINERLGKGYSGKDSKKSKFYSKLYSSNSAFKKKLAIAGAAAGGSLVIGVITFLALLPLKIESIVSGLETKYAATTTAAVGKETENLFAGYIRDSVLPSLHTGTCHSTIDPSCVVVASGTGPVGKLYAAWSKGRIENKLATKYGIVISGSGNNFYININGRDGGHGQDLFNRLRSGEVSIMDLPGTKQVTRSELRSITKDAVKNGTLWDKTFGRFKYGRYLESQFGIKRCIIACKIRDKYADSIANKKLAAKAYLLQRFVPEKYGVIMQCVILGGCDTSLKPVTPGDPEKLSPAQKQIRDTLQAASAHFSEETLAKLGPLTQSLAKDGVKKVAAREAAKALVSALAGEAAGQAAGQAAEKAVPVIGWALLAATVIHTTAHIGPMLQYMGYAANASSAVAMFTSYQTLVSEQHSGNIDATEYGSFIDALSTNLTGSKDDQVDFTQSAMYNKIFNGITGGSKEEKCDDGSGLPAGKQVCPEEQLDRGNAVANQLTSITKSIPGLSTAADLIAGVQALINSATSAVFSGLCNTVGQPECPAALKQIGNLTDGLFSWLENQLITTPFSENMDGARIFDMMAAGADVAYNSTCAAVLGCGVVSNLAAERIQNTQQQQAKQEFDSQSMFARMFDTSSSYSLVSKLAMDMPANTMGITDAGLSAVVTNPVSKLWSGFSSIFSSNHAFADYPSDTGDPFGVTQHAYNDSDIPADPQSYWDQNCVAGPMATYTESTDTLDVSAWQNAQTQDQNTGEAESSTPNPCLLIQASVTSGGILFDNSLSTVGAGASAAATAGAEAADDGGTVTITGDAKSLAAQVLANKNIVFENNNDYQNMVDTSQGKAISCSDSNGTVTLSGGISSDLTKFMLQMAGKYKYRVSAMYSGHGGIGTNGCSDGGRHPMGRAIDVDQVNGQAVAYGGDQTLIHQFAQNALTVLPKGNFVNSIPLNMGGIGQQQCFSPALTYPTGINHFEDTCNHLHLDVGSAGKALQ